MIGPNQRQFTDSAVGSETSHIMWTKEVQPGGVVGDDNFEIKANTYFEGTAYAQRFVNPIVVYGRIYYKEPLSFAATGGDTVCVDLRTGEEIWRRADVPALSFAFIYDLGTPNYPRCPPSNTVHKQLRTSFRRRHRRTTIQRNRRPHRTNSVWPTRRTHPLHILEQRYNIQARLVPMFMEFKQNVGWIQHSMDASDNNH